MNTYSCDIEYQEPGHVGTGENVYDKNLRVKARSLLDAYRKCMIYKVKGEIAKVTDVYSIQLRDVLDIN